MYSEVFWGDVLLNSTVGRRDGLRGRVTMDRRSAVKAVKKTFFLSPPHTHTNSRRFKIPPGPHWRDAPLLPKPNREEEKDGFTSFPSIARLIFVGIRERWDFASSLNPPRIGFAFPFDIIWSAFFGARY